MSILISRAYIYESIMHNLLTISQAISRRASTALRAVATELM